jgi:predicted RNase H-like HicB family nuclease
MDEVLANLQDAIVGWLEVANSQEADPAMPIRSELRCN